MKDIALSKLGFNSYSTVGREILKKWNQASIYMNPIVV